MNYAIAISFAAGAVLGAVLVRYGIGLGAKMVQRVQDNLPAFDDDERATDQEYTE